MNEIDPIQFKNKFSAEFLPTETLFGVKLVNCEVLCTDKIYRPVTGIEIGLIFLTLSYVNISD
jgi:hypothetical protein|tara:strand:+ start:1444 stop:1632 length:189 start_codon:yes stop_codon:yes gene_type:complete